MDSTWNPYPSSVDVIVRIEFCYVQYPCIAQVNDHDHEPFSRQLNKMNAKNSIK